MLLRKLRRDFWRQHNQLLTTAFVMLLGMAMFVASAGSFRDVRASVRDTQWRLKLADLTIALRHADAADVARVSTVPGVARAEGRLVVDVPVTLAAGKGSEGEPSPAERLIGRFISLPDRGRPALDRLELLDGQFPAAPAQVLVEKHLADAKGLQPGDLVAVLLPGLPAIDLQISGIAMSPEYLWVSRSRQDPMPTPSDFGVFWARHGAMEAVARAMPALAGFATGATGATGMLPGPLQAQSVLPLPSVGSGVPEFNQILLGLEPGAKASAVERGVVRVLGGRRVESITPAAQLPGVRLLKMDLDSLASIAGFFPACFVLVAVFIAAASQARLVDAQRPVIGTLLALGMPRRKILAHYLAFGVVAGGLGSLLGAGAGIPMSIALTREYAYLLAIPAIEPRIDWELALAAVGIGLGASLVGSFLASWRAAALPPAESMRPSHASRLRGLRLGRHALEHLPIAIAYPIRNALRKPWRSVAAALGVAVALIIVLAAASVFEGIGKAMDLQFNRSVRYDLRVTLIRPVQARGLNDRLAGLPGVTRCETVLLLPVRIWAAPRSRPSRSLSAPRSPSLKRIETALVGLPEPSSLLRSLAYGPKPAWPAPGELVLSRSLAREIGVAPGDRVAVRLTSGVERRVVLSALSDSAIGGTAVMRLADVWRAFGATGSVNVGLLSAPSADLTGLRNRLDSWPDVADVRDMRAFKAVVFRYLSLGYVLLGIMLAFCGVLAAAILFNTSTLAILERVRELATLQALGLPFRQVAAILTLEHVLIGLLGIAVGLPAGIEVGRWLLGLYQTDLFTLPFVISPRALAAACAGVFVVALLAEWPGLIWLRRLKLSEAVRELSG